MPNTPTSAASTEVARILESAQRLGIEMDEGEALQWLTAIAAGQTGEVVVDTRTGVFGHKVTMLDFSSQELERFRRIGKLVELPERPGVVESALALSGSAAQSKINTFPGDCDYFERVNIKAATREEACIILADLLREKAANTTEGPGYRMLEVKFGSYPYDVLRDGKAVRHGNPIAWKPEEIKEGKLHAFWPDGTPATITWEDVATDPGWCKLDWIIADAARGQLSNASNMLDVTWEAPDGTITPLDGFLDPYFQEVYLEAESLPIFSKLARQVSDNALDDYVAQLENEVNKYLSKDLNYGKAARRMYNIFRLTGRYHEAAFIRELFDEPATVLYQVWSLIRTLNEAAAPGSQVTLDTLLAQSDNLILTVIQVLDGEMEVEIVRQLLRLRDSIVRQEYGDERGMQVETAQAQVINIVNNFFHERLTAVPTIKEYMDRYMVQKVAEASVKAE
jgi:hypothetical protein